VLIENRMPTFKFISLLILLALVAVFTFQNTEAVEVNFLFWSIFMSISLMLLTALFLGIIVGLSVSFLNVRRKNKRKKGDNELIHLNRQKID
jgi:uncharacterized integral membrane protein